LKSLWSAERNQSHLQYSTCSSNTQRISQKSFLELAYAGHAYIKESPVLWCTECQTSIAQAELDSKDIANTLDTSNQHGVVVSADSATASDCSALPRIRRLMPRECFRLQGFTDEQIDKLLENSSDTQAYKQAGNAVTVNVVCAIGEWLREFGQT